MLDKLEVKNLLHEKYHVDISDSMIQSERFPVYLSDVDRTYYRLIINYLVAC